MGSAAVRLHASADFSFSAGDAQMAAPGLPGPGSGWSVAHATVDHGWQRAAIMPGETSEALFTCKKF